MAGFMPSDPVRWDDQRRARRGFPESVLGTGKSLDDLETVVRRLAGEEAAVLFTRIEEPMAEALQSHFPERLWTYDPVSRTLIHGKLPPPDADRQVAVLTAGTADIPVAREAEWTLKAEGVTVLARYDLGVAGIHRLMGVWPEVSAADVVIVVAGMDGALPSVVAGLASQPVIAVPTSVGYGAHFSGLAPLLTMLNSCAEGLAVVNIDNGFGAARLASQIVRLKRRAGVNS
ncbi:MAG: nickel pincer cofactor biosynthesis protein LarB [Firmicutes bacterium]|nr:nickel pincer cofactor biosynthesis protein LarB [Bacillota bacterium]